MQGGKPEFFLKKWGKMYIDRTYENGQIAPFGSAFMDWLKTGTSLQSKSNGCVMRISPLLHLKNKEEAFERAIEITKTTRTFKHLPKQQKKTGINAVPVFLKIILC